MTIITNNEVTQPMDEEILEEGEGDKAEASHGTRRPQRRLMDELLKSSPLPPTVGTLVEGEVIAKEKMALYIDIPPFGTGIIFGKEYLNAKDIIKKISVGDRVTAKVVDPEGEGSYVELSLKEAKQAIIWNDAERAMRTKAQFDIVVKEANKGGLILEWNGIDGFLPASQLKPEHYPRVPDGDKEKIMEELGKFVGQPLSVSIIGTDQKEGKLIFSEKTEDSKLKKEMIGKYTLGDVIEGEVTGTVDFGIFIKIQDGLEGLVHISEIDWSLVENPRDLFKVGDKVRAKIIDIKDDKVSLSIKALKDNPWNEAEKKYKRGDVVEGVVIKHNKHGALVSIEEGVAGLVHISEFKSEEDLRNSMELGKKYTFTINIFEPKDQRMTLLLGAVPERVQDEKKAKTAAKPEK